MTSQVMIEFEDRSDHGPHRVGPFRTYTEAQKHLRRMTCEWNATIVPMVAPGEDLASQTPTLVKIECPSCFGLNSACNLCGGGGYLMRYSQLPVFRTPVRITASGS